MLIRPLDYKSGYCLWRLRVDALIDAKGFIETLYSNRATDVTQ